jgi:hypothetical protein
MDRSTVGELKKFMKVEFMASDISKVVWDKQLITIEDNQQLISSIISELKSRTNGTFKETNILVATFNFDRRMM